MRAAILNLVGLEVNDLVLLINLNDDNQFLSKPLAICETSPA